MIYTYAIDDALLDIPESDLELWLDKIDSLFIAIKKRTRWVDCSEGGIYNQIGNKILSLIKGLDDDLLKKQVEELWKVHLWNENHCVKGCCVCKDSDACSVEKNVRALIHKNDRLPSFVLVSDDRKTIAHDQLVSVSTYKQSSVFKDCTNNTFCQGGPIETLDHGIETIIENWGGLFRLTKEVTILDRNVFERWNPNYENGLKQFAKAISSVNPDISLTIVTRYRKKHRTERDKTDYIIRDEMKDVLRKLNSRFIRIILCKTLREHDRFILFDNIVGAQINRGLDTFVPSNQKDLYRLTYTYADEVDNLIREALRSQIKDGDFGPIIN